MAIEIHSNLRVSGSEEGLAGGGIDAARRGAERMPGDNRQCIKHGALRIQDLRAAMMVPGGWPRWCADEAEWQALWKACGSLLHSSLKKAPSTSRLRIPPPPSPTPARSTGGGSTAKDATHLASAADGRGERWRGGEAAAGKTEEGKAGVSEAAGQGATGGLFASGAWVGARLAVVGGAVVLRCMCL